MSRLVVQISTDTRDPILVPEAPSIKASDDGWDAKRKIERAGWEVKDGVGKWPYILFSHRTLVTESKTLYGILVYTKGDVDIKWYVEQVRYKEALLAALKFYSIHSNEKT